MTAFFGGRFSILKQTLMKPKQIIITVIAAVLVILATVATVRSCDREKQIEHTVEIHDTIHDIQWKEVTLTETKVEKIKIHDTLYVMRDSVYYMVDSVYADIPIYCYQTDTIFENDSVKLKIGIECSGYDVSLDRLYYDLQYKYYTIHQPKKRNRLGFMVGVMGGAGIDPTTGKVVPSIGIGVGVGITTKKF